MERTDVSEILQTGEQTQKFRKNVGLQLQDRREQGRTKLDASGALFLRTPVDLSNNLPSRFGDVYCAFSTFTLGIRHIFSNVDLGPEEGRLDDDVSLVRRVQGCDSGEVARRSVETEGGINRGIRETNVEWGVVGESADEEFTTSVGLGGGVEGDVSVDEAV